VGILGDTAPQTNETFLVDLAGATNASIAVPQGRGTIVDDDRRGPILGHEPPRH
jgi:hypothetical protein